MTLVAEGKVSLDGPANRYLSNSRIEADLAARPGALLREYGRLAYPPGSCYDYSNVGFAALGAIALNLTGTDVRTVMEQRVLTTLELHDSFFDTDVTRLPTAATRYEAQANPIPSRMLLAVDADRRESNLLHDGDSGVWRALRERS